MSRSRVLAIAGTALATVVMLSGVNLYAQRTSSSRAESIKEQASPSTSTTSDQLDYTTNWIGNTYGGAGTGAYDAMRHVPLDINGIYVTPDGKVYTNTPWEEGGRPVSVFKNGKLISPLNNLNNSPNWSNGGGMAVAADQQYIFRSNSPNGTGVTILDTKNLDQANNPDGSPLSLTGSTTLNNSQGIFGMAISNGNLYVAEDDQNVVDEFSLSTLKLVKTFEINNPARIAVDSAGGIWISHRDLTPLPALNGNVYNINGQMGLPTVDHYDASGTFINAITLPDNGQVGALWIDQYGFLYVGDTGPDQNIKVYANLQHAPVLIKTIGVKGGDYAGNVDESGEVGPLRFRGITGIGTDAQNNLYVSESGFGFDAGVGHGAQLQSYDMLGNKNWEVDGLEFVTTASPDPQSKTDVYDVYHHYKVDYDNSGDIGTYVNDTYNRFLYPDDVRVTSAASTAEVKYIQGKKFLVVSNQGGVLLEFFRFDDSPSGPGEDIGIPSAAFDYGAFQGDYQDFAVQPLDGEFIWRDMNGDGQMQMNEFIEPPNNMHRDGAGFFVDSNGDVWQVNYNSNVEGSIHLRRYLFQGLDSFGNPIYDFTHVITYNVPTDFPTLTALQFAIFRPNDSDGGTLYVSGNSPNTGNFSQIIRIDHWDKGNRTPTWTINVPWDPDPNNNWIPNSFVENGRFLFVDFNVPHYVQIYSAQNGQYVGSFTPGTDVGGLPNVGNDDEWKSMSSYKLDDGRYVLIKEEDYQAKQLVYTWTPPAALPAPPVSMPPSSVQGTPDDEAVNLSWQGSSNALIYNVYDSTSPGGPYTLLYNGITSTSQYVPGLLNGSTYYIELTALTETGLSAPSAPIAVTPVPYGTTYEAESGVLTGCAGIYPGPLDSNQERVGCLTPGSTFTLTVNVATAGTYAMRLYYGNGDSTPTDTAYIGLSINGGALITSPNLPYTGGYQIPGYVTYNIPLNARSNTLVFGNPASDPNGAPDIDRIVIPAEPIS